VVVSIPKLTQVVNELRKNPVFQSTPIMALTASGSLGERDRITASGFDACLVKPIGPAKLRETVASLLLQSGSTV
jgi:CheY-like chemotaxis protein